MLVWTHKDITSSFEGTDYPLVVHCGQGWYLSMKAWEEFVQNKTQEYFTEHLCKTVLNKQSHSLEQIESKFSKQQITRSMVDYFFERLLMSISWERGVSDWIKKASYCLLRNTCSVILLLIRKTNCLYNGASSFNWDFSFCLDNFPIKSIDIKFSHSQVRHHCVQNISSIEKYLLYL